MGSEDGSEQRPRLHMAIGAVKHPDDQIVGWRPDGIVYTRARSARVAYAALVRLGCADVA